MCHNFAVKPCLAFIFIIIFVAIIVAVLLNINYKTEGPIPYGLKANYLCDSTEKQNETLKDAISECESTPNCEKVLDERCDNQGPFMLCTSASLDIPAPLTGSCIYIRNYSPVNQCGIFMDDTNILSRCRLKDLEACDINQACVQKDPQNKEWGDCICKKGYHTEYDSCVKTPCPENGDEGSPYNTMLHKIVFVAPHYIELRVILIMTLTVAFIALIIAIFFYIRMKQSSNRTRLDTNLRHFSFQQIMKHEKNEALDVERY